MGQQTTARKVLLKLRRTISLHIVDGFSYETKAHLSACGKL